MSDDLTQVFLEELAELIESLEKGLIDLKETPDDAGRVNQVFRDLHTIKGSGAMFGFTDLAAFIHDFETAFEHVRSGKVPVSPELIRLGLAARDEIPKLVEGTPDPEGKRAEILAQLNQITGQGAPAAAAETAAAPEEKATAPRRIRFQLTGQALTMGARPELLLKEFTGLGATNIVADLADLPNLDTLDPDACHIAWSFDLPVSVSDSDIEDVFMFVDAQWSVVTTEVAKPAAKAKTAPAPAKSAPAAAKPASKPPEPTAEPLKPLAAAQHKPAAAPAAAASEPASSLRVPAARLDMLMDAVGELVTVEARLTELARKSRDPALLATAEEISRLASGLRDSTMSMRMVQMRTIVARFRRLILGLSDELGKPVDFVVNGEDTELDKTVIEKMVDPLVHILRNAIDHGMETPAERSAAGKEPKGRIELSAEHAGGEVLVIVRDDGKGIDPARIRAKAIERGMIAPDAQLTDQQSFQLILEPGFSTSETVTELSGRGVGMDVVRRTIEGLRGSIDIDSVKGQGTSVTLRLPLTLAIIEGLLIEIGGELYTLPMASVKEIIELPKDKEQASKSGDYLDIRGQFVPFVRLRKMFACAGDPPPSQNVVVVETADARLGVVVDRIIGTNQTVIKQISKLQRAAREFSGATILGDGSVSLILDVPQLMSSAGRLVSRKSEAVA